jgi:U1 small nuclear ribonucleoprotein
MTDKLPENLLRLFVPRPPLRYMPPVDKDPTERNTVPVTALTSVLERAKEVDAKYKDQEHPATESPLEKQMRERTEKIEQKAKMATKEGLKTVCK